MKTFIWKILILLLICWAFTLIPGVMSAMNIFKNDFESRWEELSKDVHKLNEYTAKHPNVELRKAEVEGIDLEGVVFSGATFESVKWEEVDGSKATLTKVVFRKCKFVGGKWEDGIMTNVLFEDCEFVSTSFSGCTMTNVLYKNCKINETGIGYLKGGKVEFENCYWDTGAGGDSSCEFYFKNSTLEGVSFSMMKNGVPILIEDCTLDEVNFGKSHFSDVTLRRVRQGEGGIKFNGITAENIRLEKVELDGIGFMGSRAKTAIIIDSEVLAIGFSGGGVGKITFRNSIVQYFDIAESMMPNVEFNSCRLIEPMLYDGFIKEFVIRDSSIKDITGNGFKADTVVWDNVTLDGKIDFTNAYIKDFRPARLKRGPRLQLITTGSNIRL